ncbi:MAG: ribonuclease III [Spirochaetia bacterium]|nr:ribonuclease III [Spirochaetia bacterium]
MNNNLLSKERKSQLIKFCKSVKISFNNLDLLNQAFCHRSITNEVKYFKNNERLEFLGDSVLGMVTASYLYNHYDIVEGDLAKIKSVVVSEKILSEIALEINIQNLLILGKGEEKSGGRKKPAILADCMEAIIGAYYLDSGFKSVEKYVLSFMIPQIEKVFDSGIKDYKTILQEKFQKISKMCPRYELISKTGPEHAQVFSVVVHLNDMTYGPCSGNSKKQAEQEVAKLALKSGIF